MTISTCSDERKATPIATGVLDYFPDALADVARLSKIGNDKHNPNEPLHWARGKSDDHADCIMRHMLDRGTVDTDGVLHDTKVAWRALAQLQLAIEAQRAAGAYPATAENDVTEEEFGSALDSIVVHVLSGAAGRDVGFGVEWLAHIRREAPQYGAEAGEACFHNTPPAAASCSVAALNFDERRAIIRALQAAYEPARLALYAAMDGLCAEDVAALRTLLPFAYRSDSVDAIRTILTVPVAQRIGGLTRQPCEYAQLNEAERSVILARFPKLPCPLDALTAAQIVAIRAALPQFADSVDARCRVLAALLRPDALPRAA